MRTEFDRCFRLLEFHEAEAIEETVAANKPVAILGKLGHEADSGLLPPSANFYLYVMEVVGAALAGNDPRD